MSRGGERRSEFENAGHRKRLNSVYASLYGARGNLVLDDPAEQTYALPIGSAEPQASSRGGTRPL